MAKIFIPTIGTKFKLIQDWNFALIKDHRNRAIFELFNIPYGDQYGHASLRGQQFGRVTLPANTILQVDRIYIRKGAPDYDSLSFFISSSDILPNKKKIRFFAKLVDINNIEYNLEFLDIGK